ncbi:hypothetical protein, partial [Klebsiella pneumoniae]|uniref:hypothetical protein n=1 Tax=Klebsiella pneumoniae TaxID=573 RepID=UPI00272FAD4D
QYSQYVTMREFFFPLKEDFLKKKKILPIQQNIKMQRKLMDKYITVGLFSSTGTLKCIRKATMFQTFV